MRSLLLPLLLASCSAPAIAPPDGGSAADAAPVDKAAGCAARFGAALTDAFGRLDGTILAVVPPAHPTCALPNGTHLVLQVAMEGAAYRLVINVRGLGPDPRVFFAERAAPLAGQPWREGWHPGAKLDYVTTLGVGSAAFVPPADLVAELAGRLEIGARVSVFATSSGGANAASAHLIHRNRTDADGAIVLSPQDQPRYLLLRFADQSF